MYNKAITPLSIFGVLVALLVLVGCQTKQRESFVSGDGDLDEDGNVSEEESEGNGEDGDIDKEESERNVEDGDVDEGELESSSEDGDGDFDLEHDFDIQEYDVDEESFATDLCFVASERLGFPACTTGLSEEQTIDDWMIDDPRNTRIAAAGKFLIPAGPEAPLPALFQNVERFPLHIDFLRAVFHDWYGGLTSEAYRDDVLFASGRMYWAGILMKFETPCNGVWYGFSIYANHAPDDLTQDDVALVATTLSERFGIDPILFVPSDSDAERLATWEDPPFAVDDCCETTSFEVYTPGTAYGTIRILTRESLAEAMESSSLDRRDILVIDHGPSDLSAGVSGIVTAGRQGPLSHVNVACHLRGTPNFYLQHCTDVFESLADTLVRLDVDATGYTVRRAEEAEATEYWDTHRPRITVPTAPDYESTSLPAMLDIPVSSFEDRRTARARFGGKAAQLATLYQGPFDPELSVPGFVIPVSYYRDFLEENTIAVVVDGVEQDKTLYDYVNDLAWESRFQTDAQYRRDVLGRLVETIHDGYVSPGLVARLAARIGEVFGSPETLVRFRSSSTMEDSIEFNGAGLYESTGACAADSLYADLQESRCPPEIERRTLQRALKKVWASFWSYQAVSERLYYGVLDPDAAAMAILVTPSFREEIANGIALTGMPYTLGDNRLLVNSQVGENNLATPDTNEVPETAILDMESGELVEIRFAGYSSLLPRGDYVLTMAQYRQLGSVLDSVRSWFPIDCDRYPREDVLLDVEFKFDASDRLKIKQIRPFLRASDLSQNSGDFRATIAEGQFLCGRFTPTNSITKEFLLLTRVSLVSGGYGFHADRAPSHALAARIQFGPDRLPLVPDGEPHWTLEVSQTTVDRELFQYRYAQSFQGEGHRAELHWMVRFENRYGLPYATSVLVDDSSLMAQPNNWELTVEAEGREELVSLAACELASLPQWTFEAENASGDRYTFDVRSYPNQLGASYAGTMGLAATIGGTRILVNDYFSLAYTAGFHNTNQQFFARLPVSMGTTCAVMLAEPTYDGQTGAMLTYFDCSWIPLYSETPTFYMKTRVDSSEGESSRR